MKLNKKPFVANINTTSILKEDPNYIEEPPSMIGIMDGLLKFITCQGVSAF